MADTYFVRRNGKVSGPHSKEAVHAAVKSKKLTADDMIGPSKDGPWKKLPIATSKRVAVEEEFSDVEGDDLPPLPASPMKLKRLKKNKEKEHSLEAIKGRDVAKSSNKSLLLAALVVVSVLAVTGAVSVVFIYPAGTSAEPLEPSLPASSSLPLTNPVQTDSVSEIVLKEAFSTTTPTGYQLKNKPSATNSALSDSDGNVFFRLNGRNSHPERKDHEPTVIAFDTPITFRDECTLSIKFRYRSTSILHVAGGGLKLVLFPSSKRWTPEQIQTLTDYDIGIGVPATLCLHIDDYNHMGNNVNKYEPNAHHVELTYNGSGRNSAPQGDGWVETASLPYPRGDGKWHDVNLYRRQHQE